MVLQGMRDASFQIHPSPVYQAGEGWISMTEHWDSSASSHPTQCILFVLRLPSCREARESHYQHGPSGLRTVVLGVCWLQGGRDHSLAGETAAGRPHPSKEGLICLQERGAVCGQAQHPHICRESDTPEAQPADMRGRSRSGQTKAPRDPSAGPVGRDLTPPC